MHCCSFADAYLIHIAEWFIGLVKAGLMNTRSAFTIDQDQMQQAAKSFIQSIIKYDATGLPEGNIIILERS